MSRRARMQGDGADVNALWMHSCSSVEFVAQGLRVPGAASRAWRPRVGGCNADGVDAGRVSDGQGWRSTGQNCRTPWNPRALSKCQSGLPPLPCPLTPSGSGRVARSEDARDVLCWLDAQDESAGAGGFNGQPRAVGGELFDGHVREVGLPREPEKIWVAGMGDADGKGRDGGGIIRDDRRSGRPGIAPGHGGSEPAFAVEGHPSVVG